MSETLAPQPSETQIQDKALAEQMAYVEKPHRDAAVEALKEFEAEYLANQLAQQNPEDEVRDELLSQWQAEMALPQTPEAAEAGTEEIQVEPRVLAYAAIARNVASKIVKAPKRAGKKVIDSHNAYHQKEAEAFIAEVTAEETEYQRVATEEGKIRQAAEQRVAEEKAARENASQAKSKQPAKGRREHEKQPAIENQPEAIPQAEALAGRALAESRQRQEVERLKQEEKYIATRIAHGDKKAAKESIQSFGPLEAKKLAKKIILRAEVKQGQRLSKTEKEKLYKQLLDEIDLHNKNAGELKSEVAPLLSFLKDKPDHRLLASQAIEHNMRHRALKSRAMN